MKMSATVAAVLSLVGTQSLTLGVGLPESVPGMAQGNDAHHSGAVDATASSSTDKGQDFTNLYTLSAVMESTQHRLFYLTDKSTQRSFWLRDGATRHNIKARGYVTSDRVLLIEKDSQNGYIKLAGAELTHTHNTPASVLPRTPENSPVPSQSIAATAIQPERTPLPATAQERMRRAEPTSQAQPNTASSPGVTRTMIWGTSNSRSESRADSSPPSADQDAPTLENDRSDYTRKTSAITKQPRPAQIEFISE